MSKQSFASVMPKIKAALVEIKAAEKRTATVAELAAKLSDEFETPKQVAEWLMKSLGYYEVKRNGSNPHKALELVVSKLKGTSPAELFVTVGGGSKENTAIELLDSEDLI